MIGSIARALLIIAILNAALYHHVHAADIELSDGVATAGSFSSAGEYQHYAFDVSVASPRVTVTIDHSVGSFDLYVRVDGQRANVTSHHYHQFGGVSNTITFPAYNGVRCYLQLVYYYAAMSYTITATQAQDTILQLTSGVAVNVSLTAYQHQRLAFAVPSPAGVVVEFASPQEYEGVYISVDGKEATPTSSGLYIGTSGYLIEGNSKYATSYSFMIRNTFDSLNLKETLRVSYLQADIIMPLTDGVSQSGSLKAVYASGYKLGDAAYQRYTFPVGKAVVTSIRLELSSSGNGNVYVRCDGQLASATSYQYYYSTSYTSSGILNIPSPADINTNITFATSYSVLVVADISLDYRIIASTHETHGGTGTLTNGITRTPYFVVAYTSQLYIFDVPNPSTGVNIATDSYYCTMYVRVDGRDATPTFYQYKNQEGTLGISIPGSSGNANNYSILVYAQSNNLQCSITASVASSGGSSSGVAIGVGVAVGIIVVIVAAIGGYKWKQTRNRRVTANTAVNNGTSDNGSAVPLAYANLDRSRAPDPAPSSVAIHM